MITATEAFGFEPWRPQRQLILSNKLRVMACMGRGTGKTTAAMARAIRIATMPENHRVCGAILAPTYGQLSKTHIPILIELFRSIHEMTGVRLLERYARATLTFHLTPAAGGGKIYCLSMERPDRLRSLSLGWASIDEIASASDEAAIWAALGPAIRGAGSGHITITTTPEGLRGSVKTYVEAVEAGDPDYQIIHARTQDAPHISKTQYELMRSLLSKSQAAQELDAALLRPSSVVYPEFSRQVHMVPYRYQLGTPYSLAIDWSDGNFHVLVVAHTNWQNHDADVVVESHHHDQMKWSDQRITVKEIVARLGRQPDRIIGDRAIREQQSWAAREFPASRVRGMESKAEQDVWRGVQVVKRLLDPPDGEQPRLLFADNLSVQAEKGIIRSMEQLRRRTKDGEVMDQCHKDNKTDHSTDALRYWAVDAHGSPTGHFSAGIPLPNRYGGPLRR